MMQTQPVDPRSLVDRARESEQRGDTSMSLGLYEEAIEFLGDESDLALLADALRWKGTLHREQGETEAAYRCYKTTAWLLSPSGEATSTSVSGCTCMQPISPRKPATFDCWESSSTIAAFS